MRGCCSEGRGAVATRPACRRVSAWLLAALTVGVLAAGSAWAGARPLTEGQAHYVQGKAYYAEEEYARAVAAFERAVAARPGVSDYYHWLGKAYGRLAEESGWYRALRLAPRAREAFERAVRIDATNADALADLAKYYENAPGFLGGDEQKARSMRERLQRLEASPEG